MVYLETLLRLLSLIGIVWIIYLLLFLDIIYYIIRKKVLFIKEKVNEIYPNTYDIDKEHYLGEYRFPRASGYYASLNLESYLLYIGDATPDWKKIMKKVFKGFDIESDRLGFKKEILILKRLYKFNNIVFSLLKIITIILSMYILYFTFVNYNLIYSDLLNE